MVSVNLSLLSWHAPIPYSHIRAWQQRSALCTHCLCGHCLPDTPLTIFSPLQSKDSEIKKAGSDGKGLLPPHPDPHPAGHPWVAMGRPPWTPSCGSHYIFPLVALGSPQLSDAGRWLVLAGDIVDSSADSPPSLKARTHSVSTGGSAVRAGGHTSPWGRGLYPLS